ncbi:AraC family transcriptional regulator [Paenibacillus timonensis]|uniref:AraC family transcriptional regulator n=1 Tax=Paenibacillus timonensis TaxID=225915 RepID=UPI0022E8554A|nr:AraC family transcriptional regulator [Paenibacillus timonensis]
MIPIVDLNELAGQFAAGALTIHGVYLSSLEPGQYDGHSKERPTPHAGLVFALRGQAEFAFDGTPCELVPGVVAHGAKNMTLQLKVPATGFEYVLIHYTLKLPAESKLEYHRTHYSLEPGENPRIVEMLRQLHAAANTPGSLQALRVKELFYGTIGEVIGCARNRLNVESRSAVEHALEYIHAHYMEPLNLRKLAGLHDWDVKKFAYAFHKYVGLFPIDYVIRHRMARASELLATSRCSVGDIAESVGYGDAHYFSRLFKKHVGCSPSEFRARNGNDPPIL